MRPRLGRVALFRARKIIAQSVEAVLAARRCVSWRAASGTGRKVLGYAGESGILRHRIAPTVGRAAVDV